MFVYVDQRLVEKTAVCICDILLAERNSGIVPFSYDLKQESGDPVINVVVVAVFPGSYLG